MNDDEVLQELLERWDEQVDSGTDVGATELAREHPHLVERLRGEIDKQRAVRRLLVPPAPEAAAPPALGNGRFRPEHEIGSGGMGVVYRAEDIDVGRKVALKMIRPDQADYTSVRERFQREATITGRLEHPGIVPVYALGADQRGEPYYAMRMIRGVSLRTALSVFHSLEREYPRRNPAQRNLHFRELLGAFVAVCETVDYAHSKGIIHRDLKPANIQIGRYGETLLLDWGMAGYAKEKAERPGSAEQTLPLTVEARPGSTMHGVALGTPAYMSPEQAFGHWDDVGPQSDIFGLGATLYHLLTGRPPYSGSDALAAAKQGRFDGPRKASPSVPKPLEAICLKAMAKSPGERYASAEALAADVQKWLADEVVSAYREPLRTRVGRWARRHVAWVTAVLVLLAAGVVGSSLVFWIVSRERARASAIHAANDFKIVNDYFIQTSENELLNMPGMHLLRAELLNKSMSYYEAFAEEHGSDPKLQIEVAAAYFRIAQINAEMYDPDQNRDAAWRIGEPFVKGLDRLEPLVHDGTVDARSSTLLAGIYRGRAGRSIGRFDSVFLALPPDALSGLERARSVWKVLVERNPDDAGFANDLAGIHNIMGIVQDSQGAYDSALNSYSEAIKIWGSLVDAHPENANFKRELAVAHGNMSSVYLHKEELDNAWKERQQNVSLLRELAESNPSMPIFQCDLAACYFSVAYHQNLMKEPDAALESLEKARGIMEKLVTVSSYPRDLAAIYLEIGKHRQSQKQTLAALALYDQAREQGERFLKARPNTREYRGELAAILSHQGHARENLQQPQAALAAYSGAVEYQRAAFEAMPWLIRHRRALSENCSDLARLQRALSQPDAAVETTLERRKLWVAEEEKRLSLIYELERDTNVPKSPGLAEELRLVARDLALCIPLLQDPEKRERCAGEVEVTLREAVAAGFKDASGLSGKAFDPLRGREDFRKILSELAEAASK
jgi:serine/threonine-protein kinase